MRIVVTAIFAIGRVYGAELTLIIFGACLLMCMGIGMLFRCNRSRQGFKRFLVMIGAAGLCCDSLLFLLLFPGGEYRNYGIGGAYAVLLYPVALCLAAALATAWNQDEL